MRERFEDRRLTGNIKIHLPEANKQWVADKSMLANHIKQISESYLHQGYTLTLRQLYYQLVSRELIPNHDKVYKKIGAIKDDCVYSGGVDWDCYEDRSRVPHLPYFNNGIAHAIQQSLDHFKRDRQLGQQTHIELWTEKDAISNILKRALNPYHIRLCVNKGYTSSSAIYASYERFAPILNDGRKVLILYFGDHDPSGLDMVRDIEERLRFMFTNGEQLDYETARQYNEDNEMYDNREFIVEKDWGTGEVEQGFDNLACFATQHFTVKQIGLTMEQIKKYKLPPNPAKLTDPRAEGYIKKHGKISWEVDALKPEVLAKLVQDEVESVIDMEQYQSILEIENKERLELQKIVKKYNK